MNTNQIKQQAVEISRFVIENGRVEGEGQEWLDSLGVEVEHEANERGFDSTLSNMIGAEAVSIQQSK